MGVAGEHLRRVRGRLGLGFEIVAWLVYKCAGCVAGMRWSSGCAKMGVLEESIREKRRRL